MRFLRAFEWSPPHAEVVDGVAPMTVVHMFFDDAEEQGRKAAEALARRKPGERALMPYWLLVKQLRHKVPEVPGRKDLDPLTIFENGIDVKPSIEWLTPLSRHLRRHRAWLDVIAADVEDGVTIFNMPHEWDAKAWQATMARIYGSKKAVARMPEEVKKLKPEDFNPWTPQGRRATEVFNRYAKSILLKAIREIFIESELFVDGAGRQPFKISNWECLRPTFPVTHGNRWEMTPGAVDEVSSPPLYLGATADICQGTPHDPVWCSFVHCLNIARSCLGQRKAGFLPWISSPRWQFSTRGESYEARNVWLWREMIAHVVRAGCRDFLFWNFDSDPSQARQLFSETMRTNDRPYSRVILPPLDLDVDQVTTRGYTTRYSDYLEVLRAVSPAEASLVEAR